MARIGLDARPLSEERMSGIPRLVLQTLESLSRLDRENEYFLYSHRGLRHLPPPGPFHPRPGNGRLWGSLWIETVLPSLLVRDKIDLFWGTQHVLPILGAGGVRMVVTIHDLVPYLYPQTMRRRNLVLSRLLLPPTLRRADAVVTVSQATAEDLRRFFSVRTPLVQTIHAGLTPRFRSPSGGEERVALLRRELGLAAPYLLGVGTFEPRKNIGASVRAFALVAGRIPHDLVLAGGRGWKSAALLEEIERSPQRGRIRLLGHVSDQQLEDLYAGAEIFLFPSLYEGFGSPLLEAMAAGIPVITSRISSLPEVAGEAAVLVDPGNPAELAEAILDLAGHPEKRRELSARGRARAAEFSWDRAATEMIELFRRTLKGRSGTPPR